MKVEEHWNERFQGETYAYGEEPNVFIKEQAKRLEPNQKVIAFAEGEGRNAVYLARHGHDVTAVDYAVAGLEKTKKLARRYRVEVQTKQVDLLQDELPKGTYDVGLMVFGHFSKQGQKTVLTKLLDAVKPGGIIMMEVYSEAQLQYGTGGPKNLDMLYDPSDLLTWAKKHHLLHYFCGETERNEGVLHTGKCHVIQLAFQKK